MAAAADLAVSDTYGLLARYGRDVAGAFEIVKGDPPPRTPSYEVHTEESLANEIASIDESPLGIHDDSELSLAGLQDKLLVVRTKGGGWARPRYGYPSTHILKLDSRRHDGVIDAEAACLELARRVGLVSFRSWLEQIGETQLLVVERFDRVGIGDNVQRLHQEDLLQALGIQPEAKRGRAKYQMAKSPGPPSWWHLADLLDSYAEDRQEELSRLFKAMVFNLIVGNADAHAKNLALILHDSRATLAPLYDLVPTQLWPQLRRTLALTIGDKNDPDRIGMDDLLREVTRWGFNRKVALRLATDTLELTRHEVSTIEHEKFAELVAGNINAIVARS